VKCTALCLALLLAALGLWLPEPAHAGDLETWVPTADELQRVAGQRPAYANLRRKAWTFEAAVPVWIPGISGTFGEGGVSVDSEGGLGELFDASSDLKFAFVGAFSAQRGPWRFGVDGFGARMGGDVRFKLTDGTLVDAELGAIIAAARIGYRVWTKPLCLFGSKSCLKVDAYAGARLYYAFFEVTLPIGPKLDASKTWVDPIVGLAAELPIGRRWVVHATGDVGGFGVGADLAFWATAGVEYRFTRVFSLAAGWAIMSSDFETGRGAKEFRWNLTLSGPQLIAAFRW